jgi:hypothetical protein
MIRQALTVSVVALVMAAAATAATPTEYRSHLNAICRGYTPKFKTYERQMAAAQKAKDGYRYGLALGHLLVLAYRQDKQLEAVPIPSALRARMTPIVNRLKAVDPHIKAAVQDAAAGKPKAMIAEFDRISKLGAPLNKWFDAAGLRDCGSNQT